MNQETSAEANDLWFGDWLVIALPLTITDAECDEMLERLGRALDDTAGELLGRRAG